MGLKGTALDGEVLLSPVPKVKVGCGGVCVCVSGSVPATGVGLTPWGLVYQKPATGETGIKEQLLCRMNV